MKVLIVEDNRDREMNQLKGRLVEKMVNDATPPPPKEVMAKLSKAIASVVSQEEYHRMAEECSVTGESISLKLAQHMLSLPRADRKRLSKAFDIPWEYLSKG